MAEIKLFADVTIALRDRVFADDLVKIVTQQLGKVEMNMIAHESAQIIAETGNYDPLREFLTMKRLVYYLEELMTNIKGAALKEAIRYTAGGKIKTFEAYGATINVKKGAATWEFSPCVEIAQIEANIETLKAQVKAIRELQKLGKYIDQVTGEEIPKAICSHGGEETFSVTL